MRIECPGCGAAYEVREELLPPGRPVRCTRCGRSWVPLEAPAPAGSGAAPVERPVEAEAPVRRRPIPLRVRSRLAAPAAQEEPAPGLRTPTDSPREERELVAPLLAWAASLLVVAGAVVALWVWRAELMAAWPPAARLFQALGGG